MRWGDFTTLQAVRFSENFANAKIRENPTALLSLNPLNQDEF